jgi:putative ABC transport system substrate-binding protein
LPDVYAGIAGIIATVLVSGIAVVPTPAAAAKLSNAERVALEKATAAYSNVSRVAFLWNPDNASNVLQFEEIGAAAPTLGVTVISVSVSPRIEFETAFAAMMKERPDAFAMTAEPFHQTHIAWIMDFMAKNRLPAAYQLSENVRAGGLMSYGASQPDLFRRAAGYVHRILQGTKPADLPVELARKFDLAVNLKTAKALGIELMPTFIARADEVIE